MFVIVLGISAALVALWWDARFPRFAPDTFSVAALHVAAAVCVARFVAPIGIQFGVSSDSDVWLLAGVLGTGLTTLVYAFLAGIWIIKVTQGFIVRHSP